MALRLCYVSKWSTDRAVIREKHIHLCIDGISHFLTLTAHGMLVDLFQCRRRAVPHAFHGIFIGNVQRQHDRGIVMSQVMKAEV